MKSSLLSLLAIIALYSSCLAADEPTIEAQDAANDVGEAVVVHGTVSEVHTFKGGSIALDFGVSKH